jgi:polysaccharide deacetylase family sporulation protein PdaB
VNLWSHSALAAAVSISLGILPVFGDKLEAPRHDRRYYESTGEIIWEVPTQQKIVALTFDDGPDPDNTALILDLLKQYNAKATFFAIGEKVSRNPELARREAEEGHELANHTYHHLFLNNRSFGKLEKEIVETERVIREATGQKPTLFRPPGGIYNDRLIALARQHGYVVVLWSWQQDTRDWSRPGVGKIVSRVLDHLENGNIILLHEYVEGGSQTVEALKTILPELNKRGYRMVTVSELVKYKLANPMLRDSTP